MRERLIGEQAALVEQGRMDPDLSRVFRHGSPSCSEDVASRAKSAREYWQRFEAAVIGALVVLALGLFLFGSLARSFAPSLAIDWSEEVAIYLIVWATLLSGGAITAERGHVSANMLGHLLSPLRNGACRWVSTLWCSRFAA